MDQVGDSGEHFHSWIVDTLGEELSFPHLRALYPTAPSRPYSAAGGMCSNVWFNRYTIEFESPEDTSSIQHMNVEISKLIQDQINSGIPKERIIIGGFSMGGSMALHVAYSQHTSIAGVFTLSSFLNQESLVYKALQAHSGPIPPLFACHGNADELVLYDWGKSTVETLQEHNVQTEFHTIPGLSHELHKGVLQQLKAWILKVLPEA
ncbi:lysophospholipase-like protein 1 isoform X2 [Anneissia japonica]|uniref:lysophospholipase-like protein 1 isoform X2 n=1 Tax=Anneissia japonica TaxID=1529436 RepID=UPI001425B38C|nr:lysophospholipase-like protein 1 isoform X2 [Anneissia japonica]